ncbi:MAG: Fur family transcriptional regulator [Capsulimonadaceae bacterium]|nr:Fur family transcriptional regulator [Capsulimonadaceae bacterium]
MENKELSPVLDKEDRTQGRVEEMRHKLAESGHRITPQRLCILQALTDSPSHPSAEEIFSEVHRACPTTSLATIYKTLQTLKDMGEVIELEFSDGSNRYDGLRPKSHPHCVCTKCGVIVDVEVEGLEDLDRRASDLSGFAIDHYRIDFYGLCRKCQEQ